MEKLNTNEESSQPLAVNSLEKLAEKFDPEKAKAAQKQETERLKNQSETKEPERKFVKLEDLESLFDSDDFCIFGHGTASSGNGREVVDSILEEGVRGFQSLGNMIGEERDLDYPEGSTDLYDTAVPIFLKFGGEELDMAEIKDKLDHWRHRDSENVILMRIPFKYFNPSDIHSERDRPFFVQKRDASGQMRNFIDPRLIIGNYNRTTGMVEMNNHFESEMSDEFRAEMEQRHESARSETAARHARTAERKPFSRHAGNVAQVPEFDDSELSSWDDFDESEW